MKRTRTSLLATWFLAASVFCAQAQSPVLPGPGLPVAVTGGAPTVTWQWAAIDDGNVSSMVQTWTGKTISAGPGATRFFVLALVGSPVATVIDSITLQPNVGSTITLLVADRVVIDASTRSVLYKGVFLSDADTATTVTVTVNYHGNPFGATIASMWTCPSATMASSTPTGTGSNDNAAGTSATTTVSVAAGGFIIAAMSTNATNPTSNFTGSTEAITRRAQVTLGATDSAFGDVSNAVTPGSSTVTVNVGTSAAVRLAAAAWH